MASRPPPASTPIHPRLLELAAQAGDSPFSTPDSVVTASSVDKTRQTEESQVSEDQSTSHDSSGESLGIRAARPHSSGFIDAGMSPPGTTSDSESSKTENMDGKHDSNDVSSSFGEHSAQACGSAHASQANTAGVAQTDSPPSAAADQSEDRLHQDHDHAGEKAGQSGAADSPDNHLTNLVKDPSSISGSKNRVVKFYSPPPPSLSSASLKRGDYYSDSATLNLPSPRLEPILEASTELSAGYKAAMMAETPLKQASSMRQTATVNRRLTPYAATLLQNMSDTSKSLSDTSGKISTPSNKSVATLNDSMFESPLLAPMAPYGSPIRFNQRGAVLLQTDRDAPHTAEESPVSIPINKRLTIKRPPALDAPSPLKREEAKIRDMLWRSPAQEDEDAANADILPPELEQLCPPSPYAAHFDKTLISLSREQQDAQSDVLPVEAPSAESCNAPALARIHSKPGPIGNLNKIPTLVGPNSLPYARCPSGVDSFAFDIQNPRPYDVVMPLDKVLPLPKSVSCDDKLLFRAGADASEQLHKNVESAKSRDTTNVKSELAVCSNDQRVHRSSNSTASTHNERARQRMERVKLATMKREQARLEEQNKREIARITRKLAAEQAASKEAMSHNSSSAAAQNRPLNSSAKPFVPNGMQAIPIDHTSASGRAYTLLTRPRTHYMPAAYHESAPGMGTMSTFSNIAEARHTQNRLLSILQQRMQGVQLAPASHSVSYQAIGNGVQPQPSLLPLPEDHGSGVLSAINMMMHTNQQLIAMLQETEKLLASRNAESMLPQHNFSGLEADGLASQHTSGLQRVPVQSVSAEYRFPAISSDIQGGHAVSQLDIGFKAAGFRSAEPAVVRNQRRKSVTFDDFGNHSPDVRANLSASDIYNNRHKPLQALSRSVHELPPRPKPVDISPKLMGILPPEDASKAHKGVTQDDHSAAAQETLLFHSMSSVDQKEAEARRQNRSNAPSPECFMNVKSTQNQTARKPLTSLAPHKVSQPKQRKPSPNQLTRQPMSEKSGNISISSVASEKSQKQRPKLSHAESKNGNRKKVASNPTKVEVRKSGGHDDKHWAAFVRQMGGVPPARDS